MSSWFKTFRKQELPPIADLANRIVQASMKEGEALKSSINAKDENDRTLLCLGVVTEFLYFFMHMTN